MKWKTLPPGHLEKLVAAKKSVYVLNTSSLPSGDKATIMVNFQDGSRREFFKMPPTFIPMAISDVIPSNKLLDSRDFKMTLTKGMLTLVDPEQAEDYLTTTEAQEEYESLVLSEHSSRAKRIDIDTEIGRRVQVAHQGDANQTGPSQDVSAVDTVSNKVRGMMEDMISGTKTEKDVLQQLKRHQEALSSVDLSYVMAHAAGNDLQAWAQKALASVNTTAAPVTRGPVAAPLVPKRAAPESSAFDFDGGGDEMTPQERAADAQARAQATSQQAVNGQSQAADEIDKLLSGKGKGGKSANKR